MANSGDLMKFCKNSVEKQLKNALNLSPTSKVNVSKRNRQLTKGDYLIVVPEWKSKSGLKQPPSQSEQDHPDSSVQSVVSSCMQYIDEDDDDLSSNTPYKPPSVSEMQNELVNHELRFHPLHATVIDVSPTRDIYLRLARPSVYSTVITQVVGEGDRYGKLDITHTASVNVTCLADNADWTGLSVNHLRSLLLSEHISALLAHNGYDVSYVRYPVAEKWRDHLQQLAVPWQKYHTECSLPGDVLAQILRQLQQCQYRDTGDRHKKHISSADNTENQQGAGDSPADNFIMLNLRQYLQDTRRTDSYSRNISQADFSEDNDRLKMLAVLSCHHETLLQPCRYMVHVVPQERSFWMQTVDISWSLISEDNSPPQVHIVHGAVSSRQGQIPLCEAQQHITTRRSAVREAFIMKYGEQVQGGGWEHQIEELAKAAVTFDLLSTTYSQPVKVDMSEEEDTVECLPGVFVLYNCARLTKLLNTFQSAVLKGTYPALPSLDTLDWSLLREEEEWALLFNYVMSYPTMLQDCVTAANKHNRIIIHTHKVCQFVRDLCRDLSTYYSRIHVLVEAREHLLPLMFCRLYLLKAVQQVLHNCLALLSIQPASQI